MSAININPINDIYDIPHYLVDEFSAGPRPEILLTTANQLQPTHWSEGIMVGIK